MDCTDAVQRFVEAKSKEYEGVVFTAKDVLLHEEGFAHDFGELWAKEFAYYLPVDLVRYAECESVKQNLCAANHDDELEPSGPFILTIKVWIVENHSAEEVLQYIESLNLDELSQTILPIVFHRMDVQKYLYLTQQKLAEIGAWARERNLRKKRNCAIFNPANVRIVKRERIEIEDVKGKYVLIPGSRQEV